MSKRAGSDGEKAKTSHDQPERKALELRPRHLLLGIIGSLLLLVLLTLAAGFQRPLIRVVQDVLGYGGPHSDETTGSRDLFHSGVPISGRRAGETYGDYDGRRDRVATNHFFGFGCVDDCREQKAGYRWAVRRDIADPRDCAGLTWAFLEGCTAYAVRRE